MHAHHFTKCIHTSSSSWCNVDIYIMWLYSCKCFLATQIIHLYKCFSTTSTAVDYTWAFALLCHVMVRSNDCIMNIAVFPIWRDINVTCPDYTNTVSRNSSFNWIVIIFWQIPLFVGVFNVLAHWKLLIGVIDIDFEKFLLSIYLVEISCGGIDNWKRGNLAEIGIGRNDQRRFISWTWVISLASHLEQLSG